MRLHTCSGGSVGVVSLGIAVVVGDVEALLDYNWGRLSNEREVLKV